jgi:hypothetical protein
VRARRLARRAYQTIRPSTVVRSADLGARVFADARHGFTPANINYEPSSTGA